MLQKNLSLSTKDVPHGNSCEGCPFRGGITVYHEDDHSSFAFCILLGMADSANVSSDSLTTRFCDCKIKNDNKICGINE